MNKTRAAILLCLALSLVGIVLAARRPTLVPPHKLGASAIVYSEAIVPTGNGGVQIWSSNNGTQSWQDAGLGSSGGITAGTGDTTFSGSGSVVTTTVQAQGGDITFSTGGAISCASTIAGTCSLTEASTSAGAASLLSIQAQSTTHASSTGGNLYLASGIATGATAGTPGHISLDRGAVTGSSTAESFIQFERGNIPDFLFGSFNSGNTYVSMYVGSTAVGSPSATNYAFLVPQAGGFTRLNDAADIDLAIANAPQITINGNTITLQPNSIPALILSNALGNGLGAQNVFVTMATSGTTTLSAAQATVPVIAINTVTLIGGATLTFPNTEGLWWVDISRITGINNVLTFKSGSGTCGTISALTTNDNVIEVLAEGGNTCLLNL